MWHILNYTHITNFAYQGSEPLASLIALTAQSTVGYNSGLQQSHSSFPGGFHLSNGVSSSSDASSSNSRYSVHPTGVLNSSNSHNNNEVWIGDYGATHHMTSDLRNLTLAKQYASGNKITIGDGTSLVVANTGSSYIKHVDHILRLNEVLHIPRLVMNLLSFTKFCRDNKCFITLDENDIVVHDKTSKIIFYQGKSSEEGLFLFKSTPVSSILELSHTAFVCASISNSI